MPYAYNPVGPAMSRVADRLFQTGQQMGQSRRMDSELSMKRAGFDKAMADEKRYVTPVRERQLQEFNEQSAAEDQPLNLYRDFYGGGVNPQGGVNRPDGVIFAFQDQKAGPGSMHADYVQTIGDRYGLQIDEKSGAILDEKGQPIPKRLLKTQYPHLVNEFRRVSGVYRDPEYDLEDKRQRIAHGLETGEIGKTPEADAWLKKTEKLTVPQKVALNDRYLQNLYATKAYDQREGRDTTYLDYQIQRIENRINGYQSQMSEEQKRKYERWKTMDERGYKEGQDTKAHERAKELERLKQSGKSPNAAQQKQEDEYAVRRAVGAMQREGLPVEFDVERGLVVPSSLTEAEWAKAQEVAAQNGMSLSARPLESEDRNIPGSGLFGSSFMGDSATDYQVLDIVPIRGGQPAMGRAQGQPGAQPSSQESGVLYTDNLPAEPDENGMVMVNGQRYRVEQEPETQQQPAPANAPAMARQQQPETPREPIPKTRADLQFAANVKDTAKQVDGVLSKIGLGWDNWKAALNSPMLRSPAHLDDLWRLYSQFVNKVAEAYSPEELSQEGVQKRVRALADNMSKGK